MSHVGPATTNNKSAKDRLKGQVLFVWTPKHLMRMHTYSTTSFLHCAQTAVSEHLGEVPCQEPKKTLYHCINTSEQDTTSRGLLLHHHQCSDIMWPKFPVLKPSWHFNNVKLYQTSVYYYNWYYFKRTVAGKWEDITSVLVVAFAVCCLVFWSCLIKTPAMLVSWSLQTCGHFWEVQPGQRRGLALSTAVSNLCLRVAL